MRVTRVGGARFRQTPAVTASDISGTGTSVVDSGNILIPIPATPMVGATLVATYKCRRVAGTGGVYPHVVLINNQGYSNLASNADAASYITGRLYESSTTLRSDTVSVAIPVVNGLRGSGAHSFACRVAGAGSAVDTEWEITDISVSIAYLGQ